MRLLSIVPIARGIRKETLTYFSTKDIVAGSLVTIPLRKKEVPGIVLESLDAMQNKSAIKDMKFTIKKIVDFDNKVALPEFLMNAAEKISIHSATSIGSTLASLVPKICFENPKIFFQRESGAVKQRLNKEISLEVLAVQLHNEARMDTYRSLIRESFAKKKSIAIICPTIERISEMKELLSKGIIEYTVTLHNPNSKKNLEEFSKSINTKKHAELFIGTAYMLSLLNHSVGTIILEEESSAFYKNKKRPFLDTRVSAKEIAKELGARLIFGDKLLSVQTLAEMREARIVEYARIEKRTARKIQTLLVDTKPKEGEKKKFEVLSSDLREMIEYGIKSSKKILLYATRRGVASQTVCNDCGTTVLCDICESPFVLHTISDKRIFICHHCGKSKDADENCKVCNSWNFVPLGIGIEKIEEEIKAINGASVIRIDSDNSKTAKEIKNKMETFYKTGNVLVTTDLGIRYLEDYSVDFSAITSLDSLLSLPDFRTSERIMHIILDLKSKTKEMILIQARNLKNKVIEQALSGDLEGFANEEIKARETFGYAPFKHIIKLSIEGKKDQIKLDAEQIITKIKKYNPVIFPAFIKSRNKNIILNIIIKLGKEEWPNKELLDILLTFPPNVKIDASPASLL
ncbi:MAG: hypothetical protein JWP09_138 [Candidatus Taylorbacteria bacterium]|nr:hypothetical protein [Candidatus Taylorbacteria bacterium]